MDRLLVAVLGNRNAGKSHTWNTLFDSTVRTGKEQRHIEVAKSTLVDVFLVSGSPEERELYVGDIITDDNARIVLCSVQYADGARQTIDYFISKGFLLCIQWLNPGYNDPSFYPDHLGLWAYVQHKQSVMSIRDGKSAPELRVQELREFIHGWAASRGLTYSK